MAIVAVHVTPRASRDEIVGWRGSELSVRVSAAPDGGKANASACSALAAALDVPKTRVRVVRGFTARHKALEVEGMSAEEIALVLGTPADTLF
jgi:uncharacterized protein (TIGR00251 family)